jgi:predicted enzyme related to lactoylglutathione lyase
LKRRRDLTRHTTIAIADETHGEATLYWPGAGRATGGRDVNWKIELIIVPTTDVERAKEFYVNKMGFHLDHDQTVSDAMRFIQVTPPGSACSIAFGRGITEAAPGSLKAVQIVVDSAQQAYDELTSRGVTCTPVEEMPWGRFVFFTDPDGNGFSLQELIKRD